MATTIHPVDADAVTHLPSYTGRMLRQVGSVAFAGATTARPFGVLSGVRPGTNTSTVLADATTWYVQPHAGLLDFEAAMESGPTAYAIDAAVTGAMRAADSFARVDLVWVRQDIPLEDGSAAPAVVPGYTYGTVASTPPATPARCMVLAQINVPASGGGSPSVTWVAPYAGVTKRSYILSSPGTSALGNVGAIGTISLPAIPVASRVTIDAAGIVGFSATATQAFALNITQSAGTLTNPQSNTPVECPTPAKWYAYTNAAYLDLPANTASVITVTFSTPDANGYWRGHVTCGVLLPGEY